MHTFSCAIQTVDANGVAVTFGADPGDYHICTLRIGDTLLRFHRNGELLDVSEIQPEPASDEAVQATDDGGFDEE